MAVCTACEHAFGISTDLVNMWLERHSTGGKLVRAGHKLQHAGNVMTPGIGWMLAGRSARAVATDKISDVQVESALACPSCGSTGTISLVQPNQVEAKSVGGTLVANFFLAMVYPMYWLYTRRKMLASVGVDTSPAAGHGRPRRSPSTWHSCPTPSRSRAPPARSTNSPAPTPTWSRQPPS